MVLSKSSIFVVFFYNKEIPPPARIAPDRGASSRVPARFPTQTQLTPNTAHMALVHLLGEKLTTKDGVVSTAEALKGKQAVAIYFSAHWCPPCRGFTPKLAEAYSSLLAAGKSFEIVFVSSDREESAFDEYFGEQPWLALPYAERKRKAALSKKFKVEGIPSLVILDGETGELITKDGREVVMDDVKGDNFPWRPPTTWEGMGDEFLSGDGKQRGQTRRPGRAGPDTYGSRRPAACAQRPSGPVVLQSRATAV